MRKISLIERVRRFGHSGIDVLGVFGRSAIFLFHALLGRGGIGGGFGLLIKQLHSVGVMSLVIIVVSGVFIGMVLALQGFNILSSYGSEQAVGQMVALTLVRELGPVVTALLFAGRAGSALTAEIGNMKSTEQLSSLEMIGVDPLKYIIAPRLWAGFISLPVLAMIFSVVGIWGGSWVAVDWLGVYEGSYWSNMQNSVTFADDVDMERALKEAEEKLPGALAHLEPDSPGMHTTDTIDFEYIISGEVWLELDDGVEVRLRSGDTVVQNGTRHAWHNKGAEPCRMITVLVGARRRC